MKTFTKITALLILGISLFAVAPAAKAEGVTEKGMSIEMNLGKTRHFKKGSDVTAELISTHLTDAQFVVENAEGKRYAEATLDLVMGRNLVTFKVADIPAGVYFVKVFANGQQDRITFVVY